MSADHTFQHEAMATYFEVVVAGQARDYARQAAEAAFRELDRLETLLSRFVETSDISRINRLARGASTSVTPETLECLLIGADVSIATQRAFDPGYASERSTDLAPDAPPFLLDPETHTVTSQAERLHLDLGAVGKGFALDRLAEVLRDWSITCAYLNAGGSSVLALESPPEGQRGWPISLGDGRGKRTLHLAGASLSGSGTAVKGEHLYDPRTGRAATRATRVWAYASEAAQADALSTAFFVMNETEIANLCAAHPEIGAALAAPGEELIVHGSLRAALT